MSRRRGEFEHRTSIFEGAFRAWSHLGGLEPEEVESKPSSELDPLTYSGKPLKETSDGRREYPYEPLPRSGLAHPFVQAILSPWLGPDADNEAIQLGLTTLRTWWQHRRKGESGSAVAALGTEKMRGVVEGYTRHFFTLAHCLITNDKEQPPRTLHTKMKDLDKTRKKKGPKRSHDDPPFGASISAPAPEPASAPCVDADLVDSNMTPLERLHAAQARQLAESGGVHSALAGTTNTTMHNGQQIPLINIKAKCIPGKVNLPAVVEEVNHYATQLAHRGRGPTESDAGPSGAAPNAADTTIGGAVPNSIGSAPGSVSQQDLGEYGDPQVAPIVFVCENWDVLLSLVVDGITCAHCVKIVETVLKGCNGNKSPIDGLLDAAADRSLCSVLIKIDKISNAKRVAFEAARNLAMVGYTAQPKEIPIVVQREGKKVQVEWDTVFNAFEVVGQRDPQNLFNWSAPCTCPDNGVLREDCSRHSQMNDSIVVSFDRRGQLVTQYISTGKLDGLGGQSHYQTPLGQTHNATQQQQLLQQQQHLQQQLQQSGLSSSINVLAGAVSIPRADVGHFRGAQAGQGYTVGQHSGPFESQPEQPSNEGGMGMRSARGNSIISLGGMRNSMLSGGASFGRTMSGLSALSIDWENLEDFDVNVDHSAHINNGSGASPHAPMPGMSGGPVEGGRPQQIGRRSSMRRSFVAMGDQDAHVSFRV